MDRGGSCPLVYRGRDPTMSDHKPVRVRRSYSDAFKRQLVAETREPGMSIAMVARRHGINANVVFGWADRHHSGATRHAAGGDRLASAATHLAAADGGMIGDLRIHKQVGAWQSPAHVPGRI